MEPMRARNRMHARVQRASMIYPRPIQVGQPLGYVTNLPHNYARRRHDGTFAGIVIGTIAGVVAAAMIGGQLF